MNAPLAKFSLNPPVRCNPGFNALAVSCIECVQINRASGGRHDQSPGALRMAQSKVQASPPSHGLRNELNVRQLKFVNQRQPALFKQSRIDAARCNARRRESTMCKGNTGVLL